MAPFLLHAREPKIASDSSCSVLLFGCLHQQEVWTVWTMLESTGSFFDSELKGLDLPLVCYKQALLANQRDIQNVVRKINPYG
jgi:hypothetical protein